jgi:hypothetical protein
LMHPTRLLRAAIVIKPATILQFHRALVRRKYRLLFTPTRRGRPGPKGPSEELMAAIVEMKRRNPRWGAPASPGKSRWPSASHSTRTWSDAFRPGTTTPRLGAVGLHGSLSWGT